MSVESPVVHKVANGTATLTLDSPENRNALSARLVGGLIDGLTSAAQDSAVRSIVLTHTGTTFCAGADLSDASGSLEERTQQMVDLLRSILECPKPIVAVVDGHVRAGGMGIVAACDIAIGGPSSTFALTESKLGLAAAIVSLTVLPRMTSRAASRYFLTGEKFGAHEAEAIGLISEAAPDPATTAHQITDALRLASPQGLAESKALTTRATLESFDRFADTLAADSARLFASDEAKEGMTAFLQKRPPSWVVPA